MLTPKKHGSKVKEQLLKASPERLSLRGLARVFSVSRKTVTRWLTQVIKQLPPCGNSVAEAEHDDVLDDELWSFVGKKANKQWLWVALCRRTR